jgi:Fe-Mn family superoxide dismutase
MKQRFLLTLSALAPLSLCAQPTDSPVAVRVADASQAKTTQPYKAKDFSHLLGMKGISDNTLNTHFKLYQGYVTNLNLLISLLNQYAAEGKQKSPQFQEIKRRLGWEFDGVQLHELYFSNLGGKNSQLDQNSSLAQRIANDFGNFDTWKKDFVDTGMLRGIGWVVLYQDPIEGRLINTWIGEHDIGHLAGGKPILIMDVWEHAYMLDYNIDRMAYITAFFENINWDVVTKRFP